MIAKFAFGAPMLNGGTTHSNARLCVALFRSYHLLIFWKLLLVRLSKSHILVSGLKGSVIEVLISC